MKVINLFGQPSAGKSTTAAGLFFKMKHAGINCELISEYAKDMVWREMNSKAFSDQLYITAKQHHRLYRCAGKVDYLITDSPLLLSLIYIDENYFQNFGPLVKEIFNSFENINFYIERTKPYNPIGRNQDEEGAAKIAEKIGSFLVDQKYSFECIKGDENAPDKIFNYLFCTKCNCPWEYHEFGVPEPYCPINFGKATMHRKDGTPVAWQG